MYIYIKSGSIERVNKGKGSNVKRDNWKNNYTRNEKSDINKIIPKLGSITNNLMLLSGFLIVLILIILLLVRIFKSNINK